MSLNLWFDGRIGRQDQMHAPLTTHAMHYGTAVFEGIRSYATPNGQAIFRLTDHLKRLYASAKIYDMAMPYDLATLTQGCRDVIAANATPVTVQTPPGDRRAPRSRSRGRSS